MNINKTVEVTPNIYSRFQSFIVFEVAIARVSENDILIRGDEVRDTFEDISEKIGRNNSLKYVAIQNRLSKIRQMLDLLQSNDNIVLTKFFDKIWRRYNYISNLGETFIDFETLITLYPEKETDISTLIAQRIDDSNRETDDSDDSDDSDESDNIEDNTKNLKDPNIEIEEKSSKDSTKVSS